MRSTRQLIAAMLQRLGKSPSATTRTYDGKDYDVGVDLVALLNDAGRQLLAERSWSWMDSAPLTVPLVEDVDSYDLPANVLSLEDAGFVAGGTRTGTMVPMETIRESRKRSTLMNGPVEFIFALGPAQQRTPGLPAVRTLEMYPAPGASPTEVTITCKRGWVDLSADDPDRVPALLAHFDRAIFLAARRMAWRDQNTTPSPDEAEYQAEVARLWEVDEREQPDTGPLQGDVQPIEDDDPGYYTGRFSVTF